MAIFLVKACITQLALVADKRETSKTSSIYTIDTKSGRVREVYYKRYNANNNKRDIRYQMQYAKYEIEV